jgi:Flp pilus assembly protein TadG
MQASQRLAHKRRHARTIRPAAKGLARGFLRDRRAASVVEFALVTPIFLAVLGAAVDFGMAVRTRFQLNSALATASSYAIASASQVNSTNGASLASTLATLLSSANQANWACASVNINNGPTATAPSGCTTVASTAASGADSYYCPTGSGSALTWGASYSSATTCSTGSAVAGKFVVLKASRAYTPIIMPAGIIHSPITATSVVQVK